MAALEPTNFDSVLSVLGLDGLPQEEQDAALVEFSALVFRKALITMLERLDESKRDAFGKLAEGDASEEDLRAFLDANVPDSDQIVQACVESMLSDILAATTS